LQRCRQARSCQFCPISGFISTQSAASIGCCTPTARFIGGGVHGHHRSQGRLHVCGPQHRIRFGVGTTLTCPPPCAGSGSTSLVIDVWSRKVVAWDVVEREDPAIAADLVSRACFRERISRRRRQPLILRADKANAMRAATLESRLEQLGVLRSFSDNPYSESLFPTAKYRPDYPRKPFTSKDEACQWVASFVDWYNHLHPHSGIEFVTPQQRHCGQAVEICRHRAVVYEDPRQRNPRRWSRSIRCWR
jgi:transposase InsO family protein